jgi:N-acetylglucosamine-6-sulfatase
MPLPQRRYAWHRRGLVLLALLAAVAGCASVPVGQDTERTDGANGPAPGALAAGARPNVVLVLADDLSDNLVKYMPHVLDLEQRGTTFTNYTVTDSLCCPSRASIFTGEFPHDTKVVTNTAPDGGWSRFTSSGDETDTFATRLSAAGYRTSLLGKYLNGYLPANPDGSGAVIPVGWTSWGGVNGGGYGEYGYRMVVGTGVKRYGYQPQDYLTTVMTARAERFISGASASPFFLELATFSPHAPYVPAPADLDSFPGLTAPRTRSYGRVPTNAPAWMQGLKPLSEAAQARIDSAFRRRVQSVQSIDRMLGALETTLQNLGQLGNTVILFSSDNGYHMGEHDLLPGKQTAFDTDIHVPLVMAGPGIPSGKTSGAVVENVDLAPTFDALAGAAAGPATDGHSLLPLLTGGSVPWRTLALVEHHGDPFNKNDPDSQRYAAGNAPSYDAIRSAGFTYVRYRSGSQREYYNRTADRSELHNVIGSLSPARIRQLDGELTALRNCHGAVKCWQAALPAP